MQKKRTHRTHRSLRLKPARRTVHLHRSSHIRMAALAAVVGLSGFLGVQLLRQSSAASTQADLANLIQNVSGAAIYRYNSTDNQGASMATAKILANPSGGYIAAYQASGVIRIATSTDLKNWTYRVNLDNGIQPSIASSEGGGFVVAYEHRINSVGYVRVVQYPNVNALFTAKASKIFTAPHALTTCSEGSPNIYYVSGNVIRLGFHYHNNCDTDRLAGAELTNFTSWKPAKVPAMDIAVAQAASASGQNIDGNIADRDMMTFGGTIYALIEGQYFKGGPGSVRPYLYNFSTSKAQLLRVKTHGGSVALGAPSFTPLKGPDGSNGIVVSFFIPSQGAAGGEAGSLIYYVRTSPPPAAPPAAPAAPKAASKGGGATPATSGGGTAGSSTSAATKQDNTIAETLGTPVDTNSSVIDVEQNMDASPESRGNLLSLAQSSSFKKIFLLGVILAGAALGVFAFIRSRANRESYESYGAYGASSFDDAASDNQNATNPGQGFFRPYQSLRSFSPLARLAALMPARMLGGAPAAPAPLPPATPTTGGPAPLQPVAMSPVPTEPLVMQQPDPYAFSPAQLPAAPAPMNPPAMPAYAPMPDQMMQPTLPATDTDMASGVLEIHPVPLPTPLAPPPIQPLQAPTPDPYAPPLQSPTMMTPPPPMPSSPMAAPELPTEPLIKPRPVQDDDETLFIAHESQNNDK